MDEPKINPKVSKHTNLLLIDSYLYNQSGYNLTRDREMKLRALAIKYRLLEKHNELAVQII